MPIWLPGVSGWRPGINPRWPLRRALRLPLRRPARPGVRSGSRQRGAVAAMVVLALPVLLLTSALVVDVAYWFLVRASLQSAADLAALAAAQNVDLTALAQGERQILPEPARREARQWVYDNLQSNRVTAQLLDRVDVTVRVYNPQPEAPVRHEFSGRLLYDPTVTVQLLIDAPTFLAGMVVSSVPIRVLADASLLEKADPLPYD